MSAGTAGLALLLGPLAVNPDCRRRGIGSTLMRHALSEARRRGHAAVLLVGDAGYYGRFGFSAEPAGRLWLPGLDDPHRLLGCELRPGALARAQGQIAAPRFAPRVGAPPRPRHKPHRRLVTPDRLRVQISGKPHGFRAACYSFD